MTPAGGFTPAAGEPGASVIRTPADGLCTGVVAVPCSDRDIPAYFAVPDSGARLPIVLLVQEIFGVHEHIRDVARRLALQGYFTVAPELYVRQGDTSVLQTFPEIMAIVAQVPDAQVMADLDASLAWAVRQGGDGDRAGITGFCWGGRIVWLYAAHQPALKAGVAWYGKLSGHPNPLQTRFPLDVASQLRVPVLGLYGGQDASIPVDSVEAMNAALATPSHIHVYPDAPHAFFADYRAGYREAAARDGWQRMLLWFHENGL